MAGRSARQNEENPAISLRMTRPLRARHLDGASEIEEAMIVLPGMVPCAVTS
jgi:hypothetical protein